jgi:hypothetical protein
MDEQGGDRVEARLRELEAALAAATPGPLVAGENYLVGGWWVQTEAGVVEEHSVAEFVRQGDAELFARCVTDLPWLLAELRTARAFARQAAGVIRSSTEAARLATVTIEALERAAVLDLPSSAAEAPEADPPD